MDTQSKWIALGDIAMRIGDTTQNVAYYFKGLSPHPYLGEGIRINGSIALYHSFKIHSDDVDEFVRRVKEYEKMA